MIAGIAPEIDVADVAPPRLAVYARSSVISGSYATAPRPRSRGARRFARRFETTASADRPRRDLKRVTDTWPGRP